jgi:hypothetical protein
MSLCWHAVVKLRGDDLEFLERECTDHLDSFEAVPGMDSKSWHTFFAHVKNN